MAEYVIGRLYIGDKIKSGFEGGPLHVQGSELVDEPVVNIYNEYVSELAGM